MREKRQGNLGNLNSVGISQNTGQQDRRLPAPQRVLQHQVERQFPQHTSHVHRQRVVACLSPTHQLSPDAHSHSVKAYKKVPGENDKELTKPGVPRFLKQDTENINMGSFLPSVVCIHIPALRTLRQEVEGLKGQPQLHREMVSQN